MLDLKFSNLAAVVKICSPLLMLLLEQSLYHKGLSQGVKSLSGMCAEGAQILFLLHLGRVNLDVYSRTQVTSPILSTVCSISS